MEPVSWEPTTWHRLSARKWATAIDNQLAHSTHYGGLDYFRYKEASPLWSKWQHWPCLGLPMDFGSDGISAWCALAYGHNINTWIFHDQSHSAQRSFEGMIADANLKDFWLLMLISWNLEHGHHSDRFRMNQLRSSLASLLKERRPHQVPLFKKLAGSMVHELEAGGIVTFPREQPIEEELWQWLQKRADCGTLHRRVATNRFGGTQHAAMKHLPYWSVELFERTFLALEMGFLGGRKLEEKTLPRLVPALQLSLLGLALDICRSTIVLCEGAVKMRWL